jgi:hypothetical protein
MKMDRATMTRRLVNAMRQPVFKVRDARSGG